MAKLLSIVVPFHNEALVLPELYAALANVHLPDYEFEFIFIDDGSRDGGTAFIKKLSETDKRIHFIEFSRNFGKELATTAGLHHARGEAVIMLDADLQHPPALIPKFVEKWQKGSEVVIGVRKSNTKEGFVKRAGSHLFYAISNLISDTPILSRATDYRLLDRKVVDEFKKFSERERITRALVDWLGFRRDTVEFVAPAREKGTPSYNFNKLLGLAIKSFVSHSLFPLKLAGYIGVSIMILSIPLAIFMFLSKYVFTDFYNFSGTALLAVGILFLVGVVLSCLGLIALYIANIHTEVAGRPLYIVRDTNIKN